MKSFTPVPVGDRQPLAVIGHAFRGAFFDQCGIVERWATGILAGSGKPKSSYLFGQKINAVRELARSDLASEALRRLKNPQRVIVLLDRFQPYADLRSTLAHSVQTVSLDAGGAPFFIFEPIGRSRSLAIALTEASQCNVLREVRSLAKLLSDQRHRSGPRPPAPLLPEQAAAAGP